MIDVVLIFAGMAVSLGGICFDIEWAMYAGIVMALAGILWDGIFGGRRW